MTVRPECIGDRDGEGRMKILIFYTFMAIVVLWLSASIVTLKDSKQPTELAWQIPIAWI